jgi:hypothetical protein
MSEAARSTSRKSGTQWGEGLRLATSIKHLPLGNRSRPGTSWPTTTARFTRICNASQRSVWVHPSTLSTAATFRCCPTPASSSMLSAPRQKQFMDHPLQPEPRLGDFRREQNRILPEGEKSQPRRFSTMTQGRGQKGGFDGRFEMNLPVTATRCSRLLPVLPRSNGK